MTAAGRAYEPTTAPTPDAQVLDVMAGYHGWAVIARGAQAEVWSAQHPLLDQRVAVKVMFDPLDDESEGRFRTECAALSRLGPHEHVITVYDARLTVDRRAVLVMEHADGGSLADLLAREGPLPVARVAQVARELSGALAAAHDLGILHLDVKPANVLLDARGRVRLADFGIAHIGRAGRRGSSLRTPAYAAPEVLRGEPTSARTDVYGLGATLSTLATGRPPFRVNPTDTAEQIEARTLAAEPPDLTEVGVPPALAVAVTAAMAKDPADRPTMREMRTRLLWAARDPDRREQVDEPDGEQTAGRGRVMGRLATLRRLPGDPRRVAMGGVVVLGLLAAVATVVVRPRSDDVLGSCVRAAVRNAPIRATAPDDVPGFTVDAPLRVELTAAGTLRGVAVHRTRDGALGEVRVYRDVADVSAAVRSAMASKDGATPARARGACTALHPQGADTIHVTTAGGHGSVVVVNSPDPTLGTEYVDAAFA